MPRKVPKKFLFVCTGNICRSLLAEKLFNHMAAAKGLDLQARSCGVAARKIYQVPPEILEILAQAGVPAFEHVSTPVSQELLLWADVVLAVTEDHHSVLVDMYPQFRFKVHALRPFAGIKKEPNVEDPMGLLKEDYELAAVRIKEALEQILSEVAAR